MKRVSLVLASLFIGGLSAGAFAHPTVTSTATGGANNSTIPTFQLNANLPSSTQLPINIGGNQQAAAVNNQNANQANQNSVGNAAAAASLTSGSLYGAYTSASAGNKSYQNNYTPTHIHQGAFFGD
jgi:hypothetical protein